MTGAELSSLSDENLTMLVVPQQVDEFTCSVCLAAHRDRRRGEHR